MISSGYCQASALPLPNPTGSAIAIGFQVTARDDHMLDTVATVTP